MTRTTSKPPIARKRRVAGTSRDVVGAPTPRERIARILAAVRAIPRGQVASYGGVAERAGFPGRARLVARALRETDDPDLPWHRVLRADGRIAFPEGSPGFTRQRARLRREGVAVAKDRVDVSRYSAPVDVDALLWGPGR